MFNKNIIYVFHSIEEKNKDGNPIQRLLCEGSVKNIVWQPCDFGAFLYKNGDKTYAGFTPTDEYFAKSCYGISGVHEVPFGDKVKNDFLTRLFAQAKANIAADNAFFKAQRDAYDQAMAEGQKLIEEIVTCEQASGFTAKVKALKHSLTSLEELRTQFKEHLDKIGIKWNRETGKYEYINKQPQAEEKPAEEANAPVKDDIEKAIETIGIEDVIAAEERKAHPTKNKETTADER